MERFSEWIKYLSQISPLITYANKVTSFPLSYYVPRAYLRMYEWIYMILAGQVGQEPKSNWLHFGGAPELRFLQLDSYCF